MYAYYFRERGYDGNQEQDGDKEPDDRRNHAAFGGSEEAGQEGKDHDNAESDVNSDDMPCKPT